MKILQLIQKKQLRGAEVFASQISNHLNQAGHEVLLMSLVDGKDRLPYVGSIDCLQANLSIKWTDLSSWKRLSRYIRTHEPDIVQANAGDTLKYAVLSKLFFRWKQPIIFRNASMVSHYTKSGLSKKLTRFLFNHADHFLSVSRFTRKDLMDHFGIREKKTTIIPVGVEQHAFQKLSCFENGKINLIHVGGFSFEKNHIGLLSIFKKLHDNNPRFRLWLVGEGPLKNSIREMASDLGIADAIEWVGFVGNPLDYICSADVLLLPSIIEGLPGVITEAFYCGTPVVAFNVGGISDLVEDGITGRLVEPGDESGFAAAVHSITTMDQQSQSDMTLMAKEKVMKGFINAVIARKLISVYGNILITDHQSINN